MRLLISVVEHKQGRRNEKNRADSGFGLTGKFYLLSGVPQLGEICAGEFPGC